MAEDELDDLLRDLDGDPGQGLEDLGEEDFQDLDFDLPQQQQQQQQQQQSQEQQQQQRQQQQNVTEVMDTILPPTSVTEPVVNGHLQDVNGQLEAQGGQEDDIAFIEEIPSEPHVPTPPPTSDEMLQMITDNIMGLSSISEEEKNSWRDKILSKITEIVSEEPEYKTSQGFLYLTATFIEDLLDSKEDFQKMLFIKDYFEELKDDLDKFQSKKRTREEKIKTLKEHKEKQEYLRKSDPKARLPVPEILSKKAEIKKRTQISNLKKLVLKRQKQLDKYENMAISLDEMQDEETAFVKTSSIKKEMIRLNKKIRELEGRKTTIPRPLDKKFSYPFDDKDGFQAVHQQVCLFVDRHLSRTDRTTPKYSAPDYVDIREVVVTQSAVKDLTPCQQEDLCKNIFSSVVKGISHRRITEAAASFLAIETDESLMSGSVLPEADDKELLAKFQETDRLKKDPRALMDDFTKKLEQMTPEQVALMENETNSSENGTNSSENGEEDDDDDVAASDVEDSDDEDGVEVIEALSSSGGSPTNEPSSSRDKSIRVDSSERDSMLESDGLGPSSTKRARVQEKQKEPSEPECIDLCDSDSDDEDEEQDQVSGSQVQEIGSSQDEL